MLGVSEGEKGWLEKGLLTDEWVKKMWYIYTMEYYSAIKKNKIMPFAPTWMQLEMIILSDVSQKENDKYRMISLICGIKNMTQMNLSMKEKQKQGHREQTGGCQGGGGWERDVLGVWDQQIQTIIYRMDKQGPTVQCRELYSISYDKP